MSITTTGEIVPEGWDKRILKQCLEKLKSGKYVERGWSPQCLSHPAENTWGVLKTTSVQMGEYLPEYNKELPKTLEPKVGLEVNDGDFLVTTTGPLNRCGVVCHVRTTPKKLIFSGKILRFRADENQVLASWVMYLLMSPSYQKVLDQLKVGTSDSSVSIGNQQILDLEIPVASIDEQKRIVEILEEQFSRLDAALASVHAVREKAARFRRSLLHAAFTGALTGHGTSSGALPEGWEKVDLESLLSVSIGGIWGEEDGLSEVDVDVVRVTELKAHGVIEPSTAAKRSITRKQFQSRALQFGDLLLEKSGGGPNSPVGRVGYVLSIDKPTVCSNFMQLMRPDVEQIMSLYLHLFLTFIHSNGETIPLQTSTTNIRNIKTTEYMALKVPVPLPSEQEKIIEILEEQLSRLDASLTVADVIEKKVFALRRSILHAAFIGDLTKEWREGANV